MDEVIQHFRGTFGGPSLAGLAASAVPTPYPSHLTSSSTQLCTPAFGGPSLAGLAAYIGRSHPTLESQAAHSYPVQPPECAKDPSSGIIRVDVDLATKSFSRTRVSDRRTQIVGCGIDSRHRPSLGHAYTRTKKLGPLARHRARTRPCLR